MRGSKDSNESLGARLFDLAPYESIGDASLHPDAIDIEGDDWQPPLQKLKSSPVNPTIEQRENFSHREGNAKSSPVELPIELRENFCHREADATGEQPHLYQWVEPYIVRNKYQYWRYCYGSSKIAYSEKIHIPGGKRSSARAEEVREAIAGGKTPPEIVQTIRGWK